ncbi:hypothetical protein QBC38DRAFT_522939 [Podospora fimiseda]|uniref:Uncharacterized protein n=1 Tax=Podospora fimiseda TaxID=252190 RepID=A0AAN7BF79_9PEZI|nr:hypothetical protein QBC38DRAFT_522939 [Podospora fimiseda]
MDKSSANPLDMQGNMSKAYLLLLLMDKLDSRKCFNFSIKQKRYAPTNTLGDVFDQAVFVLQLESPPLSIQDVPAHTDRLLPMITTFCKLTAELKVDDDFYGPYAPTPGSEEVIGRAFPAIIRNTFQTFAHVPVPAWTPLEKIHSYDFLLAGFPPGAPVNHIIRDNTDYHRIMNVLELLDDTTLWRFSFIHKEHKPTFSMEGAGRVEMMFPRITEALWAPHSGPLEMRDWTMGYIKDMGFLEVKYIVNFRDNSNQ